MLSKQPLKAPLPLHIPDPPPPPVATLHIAEVHDTAAWPQWVLSQFASLQRLPCPNELLIVTSKCRGHEVLRFIRSAMFSCIRSPECYCLCIVDRPGFDIQHWLQKGLELYTQHPNPNPLLVMTSPDHSTGLQHMYPKNISNTCPVPLAVFASCLGRCLRSRVTVLVANACATGKSLFVKRQTIRQQNVHYQPINCSWTEVPVPLPLNFRARRCKRA